MKSLVEGKKILVLGLARSGLAAVHLLLKAGASHVIANDYKSLELLQDAVDSWRDETRVTLVGGGHPVHLLDGVAMVVKSPGIRPDLPILKKAYRRSIPVYSEVELASWFSPAVILGITGTNGKTTTTSLVGEICKKQFPTVHVAGNIGHPLCEAVLAACREDLIVAELSSFQLENTDTFRAPVAAILNITSDHLDYHGSMERYVEAKARILDNQLQHDTAVLNYDDPAVRGLASRVKGKRLFFSRATELEAGIFLRQDRIIIVEGGEEVLVCLKKDLRIPGLHNLENALAAVGIAWAGGVKIEHIGQVLSTFKGVTHRLEFVGEKQGITFINDSKGTNPQATLMALGSFAGNKILIAGGLDKGATFQQLAEKFQEENVSSLILLGETAPLIQKAAHKQGFFNIVMVSTMQEAVEQAFQQASTGDTVLLSPACASWDMFTSFEERGDAFKRAVSQIEESLHDEKSPYKA